MRITAILIKRYLIKSQLAAFCRLILTSLCFLVFLTHSSIFAAQYFVSSAGNDKNSGSISFPFKTIGKGISKLRAGDILYVRAGTYIEKIYVPQSGTALYPISIRGYTGEIPVIDGADRLPVGDWSSLVQLQGNYIQFSGFEVRNSNINGTYHGGAGVEIYGHHNKVSNIKVHHCWENGIIALGDYSTVEDCVVWQTVLANSRNPGSSDWSTGLSAARSPVDGINSNSVLRHNIVFNNWGEGLSTYESEGAIIEDNIVYDNWSVNIYISDARGTLVQRNIIYNTPGNIVNQRRPFTLGDERADKPRSANNTIINNFIYNADFWAFWSSGVPGSGLDNVLIAHNTIVNGQLQVGNNSYDGTVTKSATIENNIFINYNSTPWKIVGSLSKITFSNNLWSVSPPQGLSGTGDITGDPDLSKAGSTDAGKLSAEYFMLLANSRAIDKGKAISGVTTDFFNNSRDAAPDIGGHEYIAAGKEIKVTGITVTGEGGDSVITAYNKPYQLTASVVPSNATLKTVIWSLVNETGQAVISTSGVVTAFSSGTVTAYASANDGSGITGSLKITIKDVKPLDIVVKNNEITIPLDDSYLSSKLNLVNLNGQTIKSKTVDSNVSVFEISSLVPGLYFVILFKSDILKTGKFIIY